MDFDDYTDDDLDQLRIDVLTEQERRRTLATAAEAALQSHVDEVVSAPDNVEIPLGYDLAAYCLKNAPKR